MAPKDLDKLIAKYLEGKCTKEEREFVDSLYSTLGKDPALHFQDRFKEKISSAERTVLDNLQKHMHSGSPEGSRRGKSRAFFWPYTGIAASVLFALTIAFYFVPKNTERLPGRAENQILAGFSSIENTSAVRKRVILPDGSIVGLSPSSKIRYSNQANTAARELFLEGEAYFDVAHNKDRPFYVYAGDVVTKVVGTSFTVRAMGQDPKVTVSVKTGKVTVYSKKAEHKKTVLVPKQEAIYDRTTEVVATQAVPEEALAKEKQNLSEMHFEETPIPEVLANLRKTYDIDILFEKEVLSGCVLTSSFLEEGLYDRIDVICTAIGATYKIVNAKIVIESNGCNTKPKQQ